VYKNPYIKAVKSVFPLRIHQNEVGPTAGGYSSPTPIAGFKGPLCSRTWMEGGKDEWRGRKD